MTLPRSIEALPVELLASARGGTARFPERCEQGKNLGTAVGAVAGVPLAVGAMAIKRRVVLALIPVAMAGVGRALGWAMSPGCHSL